MTHDPGYDAAAPAYHCQLAITSFATIIVFVTKVKSIPEVSMALVLEGVVNQV